VEPYVPCGHCEDSRSDHFYHQCPHGGIYGISLSCDRTPYLFGGYSEYFYVVPGAVVHKLGDRMADSAGSLSSASCSVSAETKPVLSWPGSLEPIM
jgi:L-iditol 2-dehydrogenase